ncbi:MAG: sulfite exporter TauE/SafE family protein [Roseibium sp.]|uniref:sulfite exporter TauE/SafE family protein n=1 Tax=Roseibium sp. TaxID=1936156 RepID=UPI0026047EDD|nr:sulfite exporter TauE/SafE family protein [Roseibium sp.]MCV0426843.1 sulfite exporter TauE/SafE family protein [Roseibium sp.]
MLTSFLADWPVLDLGLAFGFVLLGASLQVATGVGLGLIAGPVLLFFLDGSAAIQTAIILNLVLTACLLPSELRDVAGRPLAHLCLWGCVGIPVGTMLLLIASSTSLKIFSGIVVLLAVVQLRFLPAQKTASSSAQPWIVRVGGTISGGMTGALAIPGPIALWTLLSGGLKPAAVRATLRAYFFVAYTVALIIHLVLSQREEGSLTLSAVLLPAVGLGIGLGLLGRNVISSERLRQFLELILVVMGISLLSRGLWDAI